MNLENRRKMTILDIRTIMSRLLRDWETLACNCVNRSYKRGHDRTCTVFTSGTVREVSKAIARLDEIAQKGV